MTPVDIEEKEEFLLVAMRDEVGLAHDLLVDIDPEVRHEDMMIATAAWVDMMTTEIAVRPAVAVPAAQVLDGAPKATAIVAEVPSEMSIGVEETTGDTVRDSFISTPSLEIQ